MTKEQIILEVTKTRGEIAQDYSAVRRELDVATKLNKSVRHNPAVWLGSATALGWLLAGPKTRTRTVTKVVAQKGGKPGPLPEKKKEARFGLIGVGLGVGRLLWPMARPFVMNLAQKKLSEISTKFSGGTH